MEGERVWARSGLGVRSGYERWSFLTNLGSLEARRWLVLKMGSLRSKKVTAMDLRRAADCSGFRPVLRSRMVRASNTAGGE
jgi:hypothetical protein